LIVLTSGDVRAKVGIEDVSSLWQRNFEFRSYVIDEMKLEQKVAEERERRLRHPEQDATISDKSPQQQQSLEESVSVVFE
jgi:hypothetical protein